MWFGREQSEANKSVPIFLGKLGWRVEARSDAGKRFLVDRVGVRDVLSALFAMSDPIEGELGDSH